MFHSSSTIERGASATALQRPCSSQLPPERPAAAATTCTNGGGGPPHSPFSHLDLPFLISPHPPAHRSSSQSLLSSTHHPRSPQSPRPLPLLPSPHPPSPRPPLIFHHRPPQINGGDQRRNFPYPSHHHLQQPNVPPSSNPKTPPHSPFCKSHPIPSHPIPSYPIPSLDQKYRTPKPQSPAPNSHRPPKSTGVIKGGTSPTPATATTSLS